MHCCDNAEPPFNGLTMGGILSGLGLRNGVIDYSNRFKIYILLLFARRSSRIHLREPLMSSAAGNSQNVSDFLSDLQEEKLKHKQHRYEFVKQKLFFIIGLSGLGSLEKIGEIDLTYLLFLVPLVAIAFDIYIVAEDFKVKRIGAYILREFHGAPVYIWEELLDRKTHWREGSARYASLGLTTVIFLFVAYILWPEDWNQKNYSSFFVFWGVINIISLVVIYFRSQRHKEMFDDRKD